MAGSAYPVGATRVQGDTLALSTTVASLGIPPDFHQAIVYNPATDFRLHINPRILDVVFFDDSAATGAEYINTSSSVNLNTDLTDRGTGTGSGTTLDSSTTSDFLYICLYEPTAGINVTIGAANSTTSTLTAEYRKNDDTWADLSATDNTDSGGATLAQTGSITWTAVTDWKAVQLVGPQVTAVADEKNSTSGVGGTVGFWLRLSWSVALDSDTEITELWTLNNDTNRGYFRAGQEYGLSFDRSRVGAIEAILAAGTDTAQITWVRTVH